MSEEDLARQHEWCMENLEWYRNKFKEIVLNKKRRNPMYDPRIMLSDYIWGYQSNASLNEQQVTSNTKKIEKLQKQISKLRREAKQSQVNYERCTKIVGEFEKYSDILLWASWDSDLEENT